MEKILWTALFQQKWGSILFIFGLKILACVVLCQRKDFMQITVQNDFVFEWVISGADQSTSMEVFLDSTTKKKTTSTFYGIQCCRWIKAGRNRMPWSYLEFRWNKQKKTNKCCMTSELYLVSYLPVITSHNLFFFCKNWWFPQKQYLCIWEMFCCQHFIVKTSGQSFSHSFEKSWLQESFHIGKPKLSCVIKHILVESINIKIVDFSIAGTTQKECCH